MYEHRHNLQSYKLQPNIFAYLPLLQTSSFKDILYFLQTPSSSLTYGWNHKSRGKRAASFQVSFSLSLFLRRFRNKERPMYKRLQPEFRKRVEVEGGGG